MLNIKEKAVYNKNIDSHKRYAAFTLAEVLITLGIIGIIGALTIPSLINATEEYHFKQAWKEDFSLISSALRQIASENGGQLPTTYATDGSNDTATSISDISKILKTVKICSYWSVDHQYSNPSDCYPTAENTVKYLNNTYDNTHQCSNGSGITYSHFAAKAILANGAFISILGAGNSGGPNGYLGCTGMTPNSGPDNSTWTVYGTVVVDVNGVALPNTWGKDIYILYYTKEGLVKPVNNTVDSWAACDKNQNGINCSYEYLMN